MSSWNTLNMPRYRLPLFALVVTALVAVVALVAHGRPLAASGGKGGLSTTFWDYTLTTGIIVGALFGVAVLVLLFGGVPGGKRWTPPPHTRALLVIPTMAVILGIAFLLRHFIHFKQGAGGGEGGGGGGPVGPPPKSGKSGVRFRWEELAVVLGLLLFVAFAVVTTRRRGKPGPLNFGAAPAALAAALDESLDDLRADPDLRRAIIAAYARMETALGSIGVPRRPAEAPLEYLERVLLALDTSQTSVRRLTDLFEWARFSHHEPEPSMRDEAVNALEAVRDELRVPAGVAA